MKIRIELNGVLRRLAGAENIAVQLHEGATVSEALAALEIVVPTLVASMEATACAVGDELVPRHSPLNSGDILVLIPPVSGG
jgi:molybdopterin converting factor small subunit